MTCAAQAAELLAPLVAPGDVLLDAGCGSGYFYHSLRQRRIPVTYYGIDASPGLIALGRQYLPDFGLPPEHLQVLRLEDLAGEVDHVVCLNVLSNLDNYHRPLERLLLVAQKTVILRESCHDQTQYLYVEDKYLDPGARLRVHVNTYNTQELLNFITSYGFRAVSVEDRYTGGRPQLVIDYPHYWKFLVAVKI
jgi:cyclopropane fatty-acyl-phospholipid synthase-like methyltransferase